MLNLSLTRYWWEQHLNQTDPLCSARLTSASPPPPPRLLLQSDSFTMKDSGAFRFYSDVVCFYLDLIFDRLWKGKELFFFFCSNVGTSLFEARFLRVELAASH